MTMIDGSITSAPIKWHGGKFYLASRIVALMPPHVHYVEPFAGGLAVLLAKDPEGVSEVVNDLNGSLTGFWRVLQDDETFRRFHRLCEATPFSEVEYRDAAKSDISADPALAAWKFFVRCRQSLAGRMDSFAPLSRARTRRNMNEQASAWLGAIDGLPAVHARLRRVVVLNRDALDVIRQQDGEKTLYYLDPPYLADSRTAPDVYAHEMTVAQHESLLETIRSCKGKVMISGYANALYDRELAGWDRHEFSLPNNAAGGEIKRRMTEVLWANF
jgi:DNA adenine methylase